MKTFKDLKGLEGIDKLNECIPYVDNILSDLRTMPESNFAEAAAPMYKKHHEDFDKIFKIINENDDITDNTLELISATAKIIAEITGNREICAFFIVACKKTRSAISATPNTKAEQ